jgi:hypothetical protein
VFVYPQKVLVVLRALYTFSWVSLGTTCIWIYLLPIVYIKWSLRLQLRKCCAIPVASFPSVQGITALVFALYLIMTWSCSGQCIDGSVWVVIFLIFFERTVSNDWVRPTPISATHAYWKSSHVPYPRRNDTPISLLTASYILSWVAEWPEFLARTSTG